MTSDAQQDQQYIKLRSTHVPANIQRFRIDTDVEREWLYETQEITITATMLSNQENENFRLGLYGIFTGNFNIFYV